MKQASLVIEACFIRQRSLLHSSTKPASLVIEASFIFSMIFKQKMTARTRGPKIPCYPRNPCATTQARNASNLFLSNNKKSRLILSDKPKISRLLFVRLLFTSPQSPCLQASHSCCSCRQPLGWLRQERWQTGG